MHAYNITISNLKLLVSTLATHIAACHERCMNCQPGEQSLWAITFCLGNRLSHAYWGCQVSFSALFSEKSTKSTIINNQKRRRDRTSRLPRFINAV